MTTTQLTAIVAAVGVTAGIGYSLHKNSEKAANPVKTEKALVVSKSGNGKK